MNHYSGLIKEDSITMFWYQTNLLKEKNEFKVEYQVLKSDTINDRINRKMIVYKNHDGDKIVNYKMIDLDAGFIPNQFDEKYNPKLQYEILSIKNSINFGWNKDDLEEWKKTFFKKF